MLRERLHYLLVSLHPSLQDDVKRAFAEHGKLLYQSPEDTTVGDNRQPAGSWPLLTLLIAQHFSPLIDPVLASSVALATECFVCALDLLDDVEDEDQTPIIQEIGISRALNVSTALLALTQQAIFSVEQQGVEARLILRLSAVLQETMLIAAGGQHRDLLAEERDVNDLTREECIEIAAAKAGAIMRFACQIGAICAGATGAESAECMEMGELLGIAHQLDNDAHDLYDLLHSTEDASGSFGVKSVKSDLERAKKTLPVVLASSENMFLQEGREPSDSERQEYLQALHQGIVMTWGISLLYRERARDLLQVIASRKAVAPELRLLLGFE